MALLRFEPRRPRHSFSSFQVFLPWLWGSSVSSGVTELWGDEILRLPFEKRRQVLVRFQFPAAVPGEHADDRLGALKNRGHEYLRIIYGAGYTAPENLARLPSRGLDAKRSVAFQEFTLGVEGLERPDRQEPLRRVNECVFGVLGVLGVFALESEPVDLRL
jgi:PNKP adenylyltransferase domain, C-terminal region